MRVTITISKDLVLRLDSYIKTTFQNVKLRSYVVSQAIEEYLRTVTVSRMTDNPEITGKKIRLGWGSPFNQSDVPPASEKMAQLQSDVPHSDDLKRWDTALIFNTVLGLYQNHDDISPGMIAAILKCSPVHVGAVLNHLGIQRIKRASPYHPTAHFIVWNGELMRRLFEQYGHEEFQAQFPDAKPYYRKPLPETLF